jgi:hypothetical protein
MRKWMHGPFGQDAVSGQMARSQWTVPGGADAAAGG